MIFFTIKLLKNVRKAIAGRKHPNQLAWAVAFGVLLGIVPHGNLLALAILIVVLSLHVNHAMAAVTAIAAMFAAYKLDPWSDQVGNFVLTHETTGPLIAKAWQFPLVPWTDINNTVVIGSFLIGVAALIPIFMLTYPIFRLFAPSTETPDDEHVAEAAATADETVFVDHAQRQATPSRTREPEPAPAAAPTLALAPATVSSEAAATETPSSASVDQYLALMDEEPAATEPSTLDEELATLDEELATTDEEIENQVSVETRIDVIRMKDYRDVSATARPEKSDSASPGGHATEEQPLDEALSYLLRQLRDSQQRKAG